MESRADSGIQIDYFDNQLDQNENNYFINQFNKSTDQEISLIKLINYINPSIIISDKDIILNLINVFLCNDRIFFKLFKSTNYILNNLTRNCSLEVIYKFEDFGLKIQKLNDFVNHYLRFNDDNLNKLNNITFYTYLITLRNLLLNDVEKQILKIDDKIKFKLIDFNSLIDFYEYLNSPQLNYLINKINKLNSLCENIERNKNNYNKLISILDNLYLNLTFPSNYNRFLWILFLNCFKPTLKYIQDFLINGYLTDLNNEFYFENIDYKYESDFWSTCLKLRDQTRIPICLKNCWIKLINSLKLRLLMKYADVDFRFNTFNLYETFIDDLFLNLGFNRKTFIDEQLTKSIEPLTSNAFSYEYLDEINNEISKLFSSLESIDQLSNKSTLSSINNLNNDNENEKLNDYLNNIDKKINSYQYLNLDLIKCIKQYEFDELNLDNELFEHEFDEFKLEDKIKFKNNNQSKQIRIYFNKSLERSLDKLIIPISKQVNELFNDNYLNYLKFFNNYYLFQLEEHSFSLFFDTLFEKLIYDPIQFQENLYTKFYDLRDFGFENTNLILYLKFSEQFKDDLIYFDIISRLNFIYNDLDWLCSTIINDNAQDFYNRSCKVIMKIKFIKWLTNNLPILNRDFNIQCQRKLPFYNLIHKLFLIKHNLSIVVDTLHSSILIKINSLQSDLFNHTQNALNYEELVNIFKDYLKEVALILHLDYLDSNENNLQLNPFHNFIYKLCEKAIDIWKIWFSIEQLFYLNFDENNSYKQLSELLISKKLKKNQLNLKINKNEEDNKCIIKSNTKQIPKEFNSLMNLEEINCKLDEINLFLTANAEIFLQI